MPVEFDPTSERHFALLIVKAVEPGCTTELQIEDVVSGDVTRITTTDDAATDDAAFASAVSAAWARAWTAYQQRSSEGESGG